MSNKPLTAAGRLQKRVDELEAKQQRFVAELQAQTARADKKRMQRNSARLIA